MANLQFEIERAKAQGDVISETVGEFSGATRSLENMGLEQGDTWRFPKDGYKVCKTKIGNTEDVEYIWIELENGNSKKFFPSTFTKSRGLFEMDDKLRPKALLDANGKQIRMQTDGAAADLYRSKSTVQQSMMQLAGKRVTVSQVRTGKILNFNDNSKLQNTQFYTIDILED